MLGSIVPQGPQVAALLIEPCRIQGMRVPAWLAWSTRAAALGLILVPVFPLFLLVAGLDRAELPMLGASEATLASTCIGVIILLTYLWMTTLGWLQQRAQWHEFVAEADATGVRLSRIDGARPSDYERTAVIVTAVDRSGGAKPQELELWDPSRELLAGMYVALAPGLRVVATATPEDRDADRRLKRWGFRDLDASSQPTRRRSAVA
ncbi:MAG: hypothetical protein L0G22_05050 [Propionibacteriaceae bacterium]|nr:hypothetical protein [Propionibacteriaceae bacterium]